MILVYNKANLRNLYRIVEISKGRIVELELSFFRSQWARGTHNGAQ